jgi:hypothetical protein
MILLHPSSVGLLMTEPKSKAAKDAGELSEGAKTYLNTLAKEHVYGYKNEIDVKVLRKGKECEDESISMLNRVFFTDYVKHVGRVETDLLSGECDILGEDCIIDIKSAWSLATFPATPEEAHSSLYEWQGRAYMHLYNKDKFDLAYCMVDTPEDLYKWESPDIHLVSHIPEPMRVTIWRCTRDMELEEKMLEKCRKAQKYMADQIKLIEESHRY